MECVAREHFKTTYLQRELTRFSQLTLFAGGPAVLSTVLVGLLYFLVAYILRTATVIRRTASIGPMLPQKDPDEGPFEVEYGDAESK